MKWSHLPCSKPFKDKYLQDTICYNVKLPIKMLINNPVMNDDFRLFWINLALKQAP